MIYLGNDKIGEFFLGSTPIAQIYKGGELIYEKEPRIMVGYFIVNTNKDENLIYRINGNENQFFVKAREFPKVPVYEQLTDLSNMFLFGSNFGIFDLRGLDTSQVSDMSNMFNFCSDLFRINLNNFDTSQVTNMNSMFAYCEALHSTFDEFEDLAHSSEYDTLDLSMFDTSKVTDMFCMFCCCIQLTNIDLSSFDTSQVTNMSSMFESCNNLRSLDLSNFDTSQVEYMGAMFLECYALKSLDLSNFNTSQVTDMSYMFYNCHSLETLDLSNFDMSSIIMEDYGANNMFDECLSLNHIKCKQAFKDWCIENQDEISLPDTMREDGSGTWEIVD